MTQKSKTKVTQCYKWQCHQVLIWLIGELNTRAKTPWCTSRALWQDHSFARATWMMRVFHDTVKMFSAQQRTFSARRPHTLGTVAPSSSPCWTMPCSRSLRPSRSASSLVAISPSCSSQSTNSEATSVRSNVPPSSSLVCNRLFSVFINLRREKSKLLLL